MNSLVFNILIKDGTVDRAVKSIQNLNMDCKIRIFDARLIKSKIDGEYELIEVDYEDIEENKENLILTSAKSDEILVMLWNNIEIDNSFKELNFDIFNNEDIGCIYGDFYVETQYGDIPTNVKSMPVANINLPIVIFTREKLVKAKNINGLLSSYISIHVNKYLSKILQA